MSGWSAILLAGQRPGSDALAAQFGRQWKALIAIDGEAMLSRVARTLLATPSIERVLILAQEPKALLQGDCAWIGGEPRIALAASGGGIAQSVAAVAGTRAAPWPVLLTTADHPLLTPAMVEAVIAGAAGADVAVGVVGKDVLLAAYPDNQRTWLRFARGAWTGANLFALATPNAAPALETWSRIESQRKKALRLIAHFGPLLALRALTRTITLEAALTKAGRKLGLIARPVALPFAEAGIDVDKPSDHDLVEAILIRRRGGTPRTP